MRSLERDTFERQMEGFLPTADVAFIDEIFKANSSILNTLLTVLNERAVDNGSQRIPIPLVCLVGALPHAQQRTPPAAAVRAWCRPARRWWRAGQRNHSLTADGCFRVLGVCRDRFPRRVKRSPGQRGGRCAVRSVPAEARGGADNVGCATGGTA